MAGKKITQENKTDETHEQIAITDTDKPADAPDAVEMVEIDLTTDEGQIIFMLTEQLDAAGVHATDLQAQLDGALANGQSLQGELDDAKAKLAELADVRAYVNEQAALRFVFRGAMGKDQDVALPERLPGQTELVLIGAPRSDDLGRWDLQENPFHFVWENPAARPVPMPRCCVTGDGCEFVAEDNGYCEHCPGLSIELRRSLGFSVPDEEE